VVWEKRDKIWPSVLSRGYWIDPGASVLWHCQWTERFGEMASDDPIKIWREELVGYLEDYYSYRELDQPIEILKRLSAYSARARYMRNVCIRSGNKVASSFRLEEIDPFLNETEFQFKIWSRIASISSQEWEMSRG